ncbi:hypothetical protein OROHE_021513 [Orobanche hederae]
MDSGAVLVLPVRRRRFRFWFAVAAARGYERRFNVDRLRDGVATETEFEALISNAEQAILSKNLLIWNLKDYSCAITVPTYEALESVCAFGSASPFVSCLSSFAQKNGKETLNSYSIQFVTVGERGVVQIWNSDGAVLLFDQKSSDLAVSSKKEEVKRGFTSAMMLPLGQGLLCATLDQQFLIYGVDKHANGGLNLFMRKRLIGYNEEIADMKFLGEEEQFLAAATSVEHVSYLNSSASC